jgi:hypothetical protein
MDSAGAPAFQEMGEDEKFHMYTQPCTPNNFFQRELKTTRGVYVLFACISRRSCGAFVQNTPFSGINTRGVLSQYSLSNFPPSGGENM